MEWFNRSGVTRCDCFSRFMKSIRCHEYYSWKMQAAWRKRQIASRDGFRFVASASKGPGTFSILRKLCTQKPAIDCGHSIHKHYRAHDHSISIFYLQGYTRKKHSFVAECFLNIEQLLENRDSFRKECMVNRYRSYCQKWHFSARL